MRAEPASPMASTLARLRATAGRSRRWLASRGTAARVALLLAGLMALGAAGYLASVGDPGKPAWSWIFERRKLSSDDLDKISEALDAAGIPHVADPLGRVGVKESRRAEALALLAKAHAVPPSLDDLSQEVEPGNPLLESPADRERREALRLEQILKAQIEGLDPAIASAHVRIHRARRRPGLGQGLEVTASVYLRTEGGRKLGHRAVEGIQRFLIKDVPELRPESITVVDQTGHAYLAAGDPSLKESTHAHAREEDWQDQILGELRHIPGVGVSVLLEAPPAPQGPAPTPPEPAADLVRPNGQVELVESAPPPAAGAGGAPARPQANVWVRVPRSFYLMDFRSRSPGRQPTPEDLEPMRLRTEQVIRDAVGIHIPAGELGVVKVAVIQDDLASSGPFVVPLVLESPRPWAWVALSGVASAAALATVAGLFRLAGRRPLRRPQRSARRSGYVADGPSGPVPGPSERVRELIRLNPESAAGVLQRWIGQGGAAR